MNRQAFWGVTAVLILMVLGAVLVNAQPMLTAKIPFECYVGDKAMPAGNYVIETREPATQVLLLKSMEGQDAALFRILPIEARGKGHANEIVFNRYDNQYFLSSIWRADNPVGRKLEVSRHERELRASSAKPVLHVLTASAR